MAKTSKTVAKAKKEKSDTVNNYHKSKENIN